MHVERERIIACQFNPGVDIWVCAICGRRVRKTGDAPPVAACRKGLGLGDRVQRMLSSVGITEERAQAVAKAVGLRDCGCSGRKAALNRLGEKLGLPPGSS